MDDFEPNTARSESFTSSVIELLDKAFPRVQSTQMQASRERMWGSYHSIRTSPAFTCLWTTFLQASNIQATPIFYQSLTDRLFQKRIQFHFPIHNSSNTAACENEVEGSTLTFEEENAIQYATGYVLFAVKTKIIKTSNSEGSAT